MRSIRACRAEGTSIFLLPPLIHGGENITYKLLLNAGDRSEVLAEGDEVTAVLKRYVHGLDDPHQAVAYIGERAIRELSANHMPEYRGAVSIVLLNGGEGARASSKQVDLSDAKSESWIVVEGMLDGKWHVYHRDDPDLGK